MDSVAEQLMAYVKEAEGPFPYVILALSAALEYVFPPFPGDSVTLFGTFLAATAGYSVLWVYLALTAGSVAGGLATYGIGRWAAGRTERWPRMLRRPGVQRALRRVQERFQRHGPAYLALNRFIPALRAFFFLGAGLARMTPGQVVLWGGLSAALWNALILGAGFLAGENWERLYAWSSRYATLTLSVLGLALVVAVGVKLVSRQRGQHGATHEAGEEPTSAQGPLEDPDS